ncbi:SMAD/FHA domain-containing protein [Protomyces lactucae-debilis]|uniref:SMAD/FHA domain-containing protein n=1 Tax=Protomyces lactucae-debilis TaxID=2754530 RepID=A0A1Y2FVW1_PROLT|nr:SMAD/FHA domain-containing protein [Protomyces lactucae-debilis]ORY87687.1 SMAD/FHA domain-containing protein [Protomyces lactucae-debilis]
MGRDGHQQPDVLPEEEREKPNYSLSGALAAESNTKQGTVLKYHEPAEAAKPATPWRLYVYRGKELKDTLHLSQQSAYLLGRDAAVADIPLEDGSCSKQHAVLQFRQVGKKDAYGTMQRSVRPYLIDLGSTNGTYVNREEIPSERYYEVLSGDSLAFGDLDCDFVLLAET